MTEQMAIEHAREFIKYMNHENWEKDFDAIQILINATEEIQQYRAIGTVEDIYNMLEVLNRTISELHSEVSKYRKLGTIEELQALKEKSVAKKPIDVSSQRFTDGYIGYMGKCPCCGRIVENLDTHCKCGTKIAWE